jgi:hypothetical protein
MISYDDDDDDDVMMISYEQECAAWVMTTTTSPCLGNTTAGEHACCYLKGELPPSTRHSFCTGNTRNGTSTGVLLV